jgi:hypothetical protein
MICKPLATNEIADNGGYTHIASITADDLTTTTNNTSQTILIATLAIGDAIGKVATRVKTSFKDVSDTAFNTTAITVGDTANAVNNHITSQETNANGTVVVEKFSNTLVGPYTAADKIAITFSAMAAKKLSDIDQGEIEVLFQLQRIRVLEQAMAGRAITTK